tara:strand:+ start:424 stop:2004 length:1581 start_codon:yes stop_codon:yes gene_type:complete
MKKTIITIVSLALTFVTFSCKQEKVVHEEENNVTQENQKVTPEQLALYNTEIPTQIMTPDLVKTRLGDLEFFDGLPSKNTVELVYDNLDFLRGVETFLSGIPATSVEGIRRGMIGVGATSSNHCLIFDDVMDSNPLFLTGNTSTVYASVILDLEKDGPTVVEVPAGSGPGTVNDAFFRFVVDMGMPGPDKGQGGKYLILPPNYKGDIPEGYFVSTSTSYTNWIILRGFLVDGKPDQASKMYREGLKVYALKDIDQQPEMKFINGSGKTFNTIHANDYEFYKELSNVLQKEPISFLDPELRGLFASIGIQKGKEFNPNPRMKKTLKEAVAVGNATARAITFKTRDPQAAVYENSNWESGFLGGDYRWLKDQGNGGRYLDARTRFFYAATVNTPAMVWKLMGKGSKYLFGILDDNGDYLDGSKNYSINIPANAPAKDFWSVVAYDPQTRSELQTGQKLPSVTSQRNPLQYNEDGSVDLYFGPKAPQGKENNWTQTVPKKGWFSLFRIYGPTEEWHNKTWKPGEITLIK